MPYAIQVPFDGDWLYVTKSTENPGEVIRVTYKTQEQAQAAAEIWGGKAVVVEIKEEHDE